MQEPAKHLADAAAVTSVTFAGLTLADVNQIMQIIAATIAVIAGIWSLYERFKARRNNKKSRK